MTTAAIPTLSEDGWVTSPIKKADYLFSYFLLLNIVRLIYLIIR